MVFVVVDLEVADVALGLGLLSLPIKAYPYLVAFFFGHPPEIFNHYFTAQILLQWSSVHKWLLGIAVYVQFGVLLLVIGKHVDHHMEGLVVRFAIFIECVKIEFYFSPGIPCCVISSYPTEISVF